MDTLIERCAGLDVHQASVMATVRLPDGAGGRRTLTERFETTTVALMALRDWLASHAVTDVAMESTGVYWKPVYYVLEESFRLVLANATHVKQVPGRKTDVQDSVWLAQLLECGLIRSSFVPPPPIRDLRELTRYRKAQTEDRTREVNRLHRILEAAGLKLATVASDVMGASGRAMLHALLEGTTDPAVLADLAKGRLRAKLPALREALRGRFRAPHAFLLGTILAKIDFLEETIAQCTTEIDTHLRPFAATLERLMTIPGIKQRTAAVLVAETGADMRVFPTAGHLCSWAGVCPGQDISAGKRRSGRTRPGNRALRTTLIEAALAATRTRGALRARYLRVSRHRGHRKAVIAVAHHLLEIAYAVMARDTTSHDLGPDYFDRRHKQRATTRYVRHLEHLGYHVTLEVAA